jgi:hypothetical protein
MVLPKAAPLTTTAGGATPFGAWALAPGAKTSLAKAHVKTALMTSDPSWWCLACVMLPPGMVEFGNR